MSGDWPGNVHELENWLERAWLSSPEVDNPPLPEGRGSPGCRLPGSCFNARCPW
ncbi:hypothetical protein [Billgrantia campisalis]